MIRAAFFDIDGTLVSFKTHVISETSLRSLETLRKNGVKLFIASGRHKLIMDNLKDFSFDGYVCMNGALIFVGNEIIYRHPIDRADSVRIAELAMNEDVPCAVFGESFVGMNFRTPRTDEVFDLIKLPKPIPTDLRKAAESDVYQYTIFLNEHDEHERLTPLLAHTGPTRWHPEFTDLIPDGLSKAEGIERVIKHFGISREETIAFGDGGNDVEMLGFAGIGVAMGNAMPDVQNHADYVTSSVDEEGVSAALRHFNLI